MKKILWMMLLLSCASFAARYCYYTSKQMKGDRVVVKRGDRVIYQTPCGDTEIVNPLNVQRGGGLLSGGADVEVLSTISVTYTNLIWGFGHQLMNEPREVSTVKNFPMSDYELDFKKESCEAETYDLNDRRCVREVTRKYGEYPREKEYREYEAIYGNHTEGFQKLTDLEAA